MFGVFDYLNHPDILVHLTNGNIEMITALRDFSRLYREQELEDGVENPRELDLHLHWVDYMNLHMPRMVLYARDWMERKLYPLFEKWEARAMKLLTEFYNDDSSDDNTEEIQEAFNALTLIEDWLLELETRITFPDNFFSTDRPGEGGNGGDNGGGGDGGGEDDGGDDGADDGGSEGDGEGDGDNGTP